MLNKFNTWTTLSIESAFRFCQRWLFVNPVHVIEKIEDLMD
jgi:hypothetical protein